MSYKNGKLEILESEKTSEAKKKHTINRKISINSKRKEKYLIADTAYLTSSNITDIINFCQSNICPESYFILLTLFTGRKISKLKKIQINLDNSEQAYFTFKYKRNTKDVQKELQPLYHEPITTVKLPLPYEIFKAFKKFKIIIPTIDEYKLFIKEIKDNHLIANKITLMKISEYLSFWLVNNKHDTSDVAIITGKLSNLSSGIHYYQASTNNIHQVYMDYVNHLLDLTDSKKLKIAPLMDGVLGSKYVLKKEIVSSYFELLSKKIKNLKTTDFEEQHNLFVLYTLNILNLSTGHRPVFDPYQQLKHFTLSKRMVYICDKRRDGALPYRFGILCEIALMQFENYIAYLRKIQNTKNILIEGLYKTIVDMLNSKIPIFLFIINGEFVNVNNSRIHLVSRDILPVESNWNRHFMRTNLSLMNVPGQLIDMFMGHDGGGDYGLSKYSSLSAQDLYTVSNIVNTILTELRVKPLKI
jgi:hypothetical protein